MDNLLSALRQLTGRGLWRRRAYLLLGLPFGMLWAGLLIMLYLSGLAAQFLPLGVVFVIGAQLLLRPIGRFERFLAARLLGEYVPAPPPLRYRRAAQGRWRWWRDLARRSAAVFRDGHSWRVLAWTLLRCAGGPVGFVLVLTEVLLPLALLAAALTPVAAGLAGRLPAHLRWTYLLIAAPVALPLLIPLQRSISALTGLLRRAGRWALGPGPQDLHAAALARAEAAEEQVRIDQELHDSIGHLLSMIVAQAGAGAYVFDTDPAFARSALRTIEERGRAALGELDRIIAAFRIDAPDTASGTGRPVPLYGADDVPGLLAGAADAGMQVTSRLRIGDLPPPLGRGVFRIVQEALTNAARHAPGCPVAVDVITDDAAGVVAVSVTNPAPARTPSHQYGPGTGNRTGTGRSGGGRGLPSIRDRAGLLGGIATTGATSDGGFAVRVLLPLHEPLPAAATTGCTLDPACSCLGCSIRRTVPG